MDEDHSIRSTVSEFVRFALHGRRREAAIYAKELFAATQQACARIVH
jgi:hypothetical protein